MNNKTHRIVLMLTVVSALIISLVSGYLQCSFHTKYAGLYIANIKYGSDTLYIYQSGNYRRVFVQNGQYKVNCLGEWKEHHDGIELLEFNSFGFSPVHLTSKPGDLYLHTLCSFNGQIRFKVSEILPLYYSKVKDF